MLMQDFERFAFEMVRNISRSLEYRSGSLRGMSCKMISFSHPDLHGISFACLLFTFLWLSDLDATNSRSSYTFPRQLEADQPERGSLSAEDHIAFVYGVTWRSLWSSMGIWRKKHLSDFGDIKCLLDVMCSVSSGVAG